MGTQIVTMACAYCGLQAGNIIEVRYARTLPLVGSGPIVRNEEEAPREVLGRGYGVCDGCLALMDYQPAHHLGGKQRAFFNGLSAVYYLLVVWACAAISSLAGTLSILRQQGFLTLGLVLALLTLVVWFGRSLVHSRFAAQWQKDRGSALRPSNSLGGFTSLRNRHNPELQAYLPVRYEDSIALAAKRGSPPIRGLGVGGESWTSDPSTNLGGGGVNEWYRLVWSSWGLWPLSGVERPADWADGPPEPISEREVAGAALGGGGCFALLALSSSVPLWVAFVFSAALAPLGFAAARLATDYWSGR